MPTAWRQNVLLLLANARLASPRRRWQRLGLRRVRQRLLRLRAGLRKTAGPRAADKLRTHRLDLVRHAQADDRSTEPRVGGPGAQDSAGVSGERADWQWPGRLRGGARQ